METLVKDEIDVRSIVMDGIDYWYANNSHIRNPFPIEIRESLEEQSTRAFEDIILALDLTQPLEYSELVEMLEVVIFNEAIKLVDDEDQQLTIMYPFMPRIGDVVKDAEKGEGIINNRRNIITKDNKKRIEITVSSADESQTWKTEFELPA